MLDKLDLDNRKEAPRTAEGSDGLHSQISIKKLMNSKRVTNLNDDRSSKFQKSTILHLKSFVDTTRDDSNNVSLHNAMIAVMQFDETTRNLTYKAISNRIYRLLGKWGISYRRRTHLAQNSTTRNTAEVCADFIEYFNHKKELLNVKNEDIYNCDQTS